MDQKKYNILLADDDLDDCLFFKEALEELSYSFSLQTVNNGEELMSCLMSKSNILPDILFLDLNMPRKTGYDCLSEIKFHDKLKDLPVIIYSTSLDHEVANLLYEKGATHYIRKPGDFGKLKGVIREALNAISRKTTSKPSKEEFIIQL
jgi:DNA-binding NtrC family response regulator